MSALSEERRLACLSEVSGVTGKDMVSQERVVLLDEIVERTGVASLVEKWRVEDGGKVTGRPTVVSNRAVLVMFQILVCEFGSFSIAAAAEMVRKRMTSETREFLGLPEDGNQFEWEARIRRALRRCTTTFEPNPRGLGKRVSYEEGKAMCAKAAADPLRDVKQKRADQVSDAFTLTSMQYVPAELLALWAGKFSIDGTAIPVCHNDNGSSELTGKSASDPGAKWWGRAGGHGEADNPKPLNSRRTTKEWKCGYEADFLVWTTNDPEGAHQFPYVCPVLRLKDPGKKTGELALDMVHTLLRAGFTPTLLGSDQAIVPGSAPEKLQIPLYELGIEVCCNYGERSRGHQGGYKGLIWVEGHPYCESMPLGLVNAVTLYNDGEITLDNALERIDERERWLAKPNGKPNASGGIQYLHPTDHGRHVCNPDREDAPAFCRQRSIVVPKEHLNLKNRQKYRFWTAEWWREHFTARSTNEGFNGFVKDEKREALENYGMRPLREYATTYLAVSMKVVSANFRKTETFLSRTPEQALAVELKRQRRRVGTKTERFYAEKFWIAKVDEINEREGLPTLLK